MDGAIVVVWIVLKIIRLLVDYKSERRKEAELREFISSNVKAGTKAIDDLATEIRKDREGRQNGSDKNPSVYTANQTT